MGKLREYRKILKRYLGLLLLFAKYSFMEQIEYRINFIAGIAVECGFMLVKMMYVVLVYQVGADINGMSPDNMAMFIGTYILMTGLYMSIYPNFCMIPAYIREGSLDMLITKPVNLQFFMTMKKIDFGMPIPNVFGGLGLICFGWSRSGLPVTFVTIAGFVLFVISGCFLTYFLFLIPRLCCFWMVSDKGISQISDAAWDFNNMPMNIYGKGVQVFGTFVIPIFIITNYPTLFVKGMLSPYTFLWGLAAPILFYFINRFIWKKAMKRYTSASS